jgi:hypothetical protein
MSCTPAAIGTSFNVTMEKHKAVNPSALKESVSKCIQMTNNINTNSAGSPESAVSYASISSSLTGIGMANTPGRPKYPAFKKKDEPKAHIWAEGGGDSKEIELVDAICPHQMSPHHYFIL